MLGHARNPLTSKQKKKGDFPSHPPPHLAKQQSSFQGGVPPTPPLHAYSVPISLWGKQPEEITVSQAFGTSSVRGEATHVTAGMVYHVGRRELGSGLADTDGERQGETGVPGRRHSVESHGSRTNRVALSL